MSVPSAVTIETGSRLHFGLLRFGHDAGRQFGGAGVMIEAPALRVTLRVADRFTAAGPLAERAADFARRWQSARNSPDRRQQGEPLVAIVVEHAPPEHAGFGAGTQLGLAIARGLALIAGRDAGDAAELARSVGRGRRSAVGVHGFVQGGLIYERGKLPHEPLGELAARCELPAAWRWLLLRPPQPPGLAGSDEQRAFELLPPVEERVSARLATIAEQELLPAAESHDFARFAAALYDYNSLAGSCYASWQGGSYASAEAESVVGQLRAAGIAGVGQSSWGPTLFALLPSDEAADAARIKWSERLPGWQLQVARTRNRGAESIV